MKKKLLTFILSICFISLCASVLCACSKTSPTIAFKVADGYVQYYNGTSWENLILIEDLKGEDGKDGYNASIWTIGNDGFWYLNGRKTDNKAIGVDGLKGNGIKSITISDDPLKTNASQTTYVITMDDNRTYEFSVKNGTNGSNGSNGTNGQDGKDGQDATYATYTITYDYGKAKELFVSNRDLDTIKSTEWLTSLPEIKPDYKNAFLGWFISGTDRVISNYDFIGGNVTVEARFDIEKIGLSGFYQNGKYIMTWSDLIETYPNAFNEEKTQIGWSTSYDGHMPAFDRLNKGIEIVIDDSITSIGKDAFYGLKITNVIMPDTVTEIGRYAFFGCYNLQTVKMSSNLQSIGDFAFWQCYSLTKIEIPNCVTKIGDYVFFLCKNITSITLPESLQQIGIETFSNMSCLSTINYNATKLNDIAYEDMKSDIFYGVGCDVDIVTINIGPKVERIPSYIFDMFYTFCNKKDYDTKFVVNFENALNCQSIGRCAFSHLETVESVILSNHIKTIEDYGFGYWSVLTDVYFYGTEEEYNAINIGAQGDIFTNATKHFYSAIKPTQEGHYWHFDLDGITPISW